MKRRGLGAGLHRQQEGWVAFHWGQLPRAWRVQQRWLTSLLMAAAHRHPESLAAPPGAHILQYCFPLVTLKGHAKPAVPRTRHLAEYCSMAMVLPARCEWARESKTADVPLCLPGGLYASCLLFAPQSAECQNPKGVTRGFRFWGFIHDKTSVSQCLSAWAQAELQNKVSRRPLHVASEEGHAEEIHAVVKPVVQGGLHTHVDVCQSARGGLTPVCCVYKGPCGGSTCSGAPWMTPAACPACST